MYYMIIISFAFAIAMLVLLLLKNNEEKGLMEEINKSNEIIKDLKRKIKKLEKDLDNYTKIKEDSLNLNVIDEHASSDEEYIENNLEETTEDEKISEEKHDTVGKKLEEKEIIEKLKEIVKSKEDELSSEQREIFDIMEESNSNLFVTGKAGTGKSYLLKKFRERTNKRVLYCAPTGIAALNISGVTLHSAFGFQNLMDDSVIKLSSNRAETLKNIDTLVIDEVSMVRVDVFNQIDKILKKANNNSRAFGGKQVILFGDLFQLPPVTNKEEVEFFNYKYGGVFFFNSKAYDEGNFIFKELEKIHRQTDKEFIDILNNIRIGKITEEQINSLNEHYVEEVPRRVVQVVPKKNEANSINEYNISKLKTPLYEYKANVVIGEQEIKETDYPCEFNLKLKVGALVMMITNDVDKRWVNGTLGIISYLSPSEVKVTINGIEYEVSPVNFNKYKCEYDKDKKTIEYLVESSVNQYPLLLAYAITIHKSQGMTYQQIACNLDNCFAPGQAYVALSRCANYDKLYLTGHVKADSIFINNTVVNFYNSIKE